MITGLFDLEILKGELSAKSENSITNIHTVRDRTVAMFLYLLLIA